MRTRQEIKEHAKTMFSNQSNTIRGAVFLVMLVMLVFSIPSYLNIVLQLTGFGNTAIVLILAAIIGFMSIFIIPISFFYMLLEVNLNGTMVKAFYGHPINHSEPYTTLKYNFGRKFGGVAWEYLWIYLWSLVGIFTLMIPTIIKIISYSMTKYILACHPNVTATNALKLSIRMTNGHKWKIFVMWLSFFGWFMLSLCSFYIVGIVYAFPYMRLSYAGLFIELRNEAIATGTIHPAELDGVQAYYPQYYQNSQYPSYQQYPSYPQQQQPYGQAPSQYSQQQYQQQHQPYPQQPIVSPPPPMQVDSFNQSPYGQSPPQAPQQQYQQHQPYPQQPIISPPPTMQVDSINQSPYEQNPHQAPHQPYPQQPIVVSPPPPMQSDSNNTDQEPPV